MFIILQHYTNKLFKNALKKSSLTYWRLPMFFSGSLIREMAPSSLLKETAERYSTPSRPHSPPALPEPILKIDDDA
jgi:hypothetical protein